MTWLDMSDAPQRAVRLREIISLVFMLLPIGIVLVFLLLNPSVWTSSLAVLFTQHREVANHNSGWMLATVALVAAALCALVGVLGTREAWTYNRRWQRGLIGSIAATLVAVLLSSWTMTQSIIAGSEPETSWAMFMTMCAMLYGVVCAFISPRDAVAVWDSEDSVTPE